MFDPNCKHECDLDFCYRVYQELLQIAQFVIHRMNYLRETGFRCVLLEINYLRFLVGISSAIFALLLLGKFENIN